MKLLVQITTKVASSSKDIYREQIFARIAYSAGDEAFVDEKRSLKQPIDVKAGDASISVNDFWQGEGAFVTLLLESSQAVSLADPQKITSFPEEDPSSNTIQIEFEIPKEVPSKLNEELPPLRTALDRSGSFITLNNTSIDYESYVLLATPIDEEGRKQLLATLSDDQNGSFSTELPFDFDLSQLSGLSYSGAELQFDGEYRLNIPINQDKDVCGWSWLLTGPKNILGYLEDSNPDSKRDNVNILLPLRTESSINDSPELRNGSVPIDVSESSLLNNADVFGEDPGSYCRPFDRPNRILGERSFSTILRTAQPEIATSPAILEFNFPTQPLLDLGKINARVEGDFTLEERRLPENGRSQPPAWKKALLSIFKGRRHLNEKNPIMWEAPASIYQATTLGFGHILEWRVRWRSNGYSLGNVAHSLTLAPRQSKRINKMSWRRSESGRRQEDQRTQDQLEQITTQSRDYLNAVQSSLDEWSRGESKSKTTAASAAIGGTYKDIVFGAGASHGRSTSSSSQEGQRNVSAQERQKLVDAIRQHADAIRKFESTVVQEVTQEEEAESVAETIRNPNYAHSLTVLYHEILRHYRVDTSLAAVRECVFVPFRLIPLDFDHLKKWKAIIKQSLLIKEFKWVFPYLDSLKKDPVSGGWKFSHPNIPSDKARNQIPLTYLGGSVYIQLGIERPEDPADKTSEAKESAYKLWSVFNGLLFVPIKQAFELVIKRRKEDRDTYFQNEYAPSIARSWVDNLELISGNKILEGADFTLATTYKFNRLLKVNFSMAGDGVITREDLNLLKIRIKDGKKLPPRSFASAKNMSIHYYTESFDRHISSNEPLDDLINPITGEPTLDGADFYFRPDTWETVNIQQAILSTQRQLLDHVNENIEYYHKAIWWNIDRDKLYMLLDGFLLSRNDGRSIASVVEREPLEIAGNCLIFKVAAGIRLNEEGKEVGFDNTTHERRLNNYRENLDDAPIRVSLPTEGLYAQAIMDKCGALEEHFGDTDWVVNQPDLALDNLGAEALTSRRSEAANLAPTNLQESLIDLIDPQTLPDPSGFADILKAVSKSDSFRDMAGLDATQANTIEALKRMADLADSYGSKALELKQINSGTELANKRIASVEKMRASGLMSEGDARKHANQIAGSMHKNDSFMNDINDMYGAGRKGGNVLEQEVRQGENTVKTKYFPSGMKAGFRYAYNDGFVENTWRHLTGNETLEGIVGELFEEFATEELLVPHWAYMAGEISYAFAKGVGKEFVKVNEQFRDAYSSIEKDILSKNEIDYETFKAFQKLRGFQSRSVKATFGEIFNAGIKSALNEAIKQLEETVIVGTLKFTVSDKVFSLGDALGDEIGDRLTGDYKFALDVLTQEQEDRVQAYVAEKVTSVIELYIQEVVKSMLGNWTKDRATDMAELVAESKNVGELIYERLLDGLNFPQNTVPIISVERIVNNSINPCLQNLHLYVKMKADMYINDQESRGQAPDLNIESGLQNFLLHYDEFLYLLKIHEQQLPESLFEPENITLSRIRRMILLLDILVEYVTPLAILGGANKELHLLIEMRSKLKLELPSSQLNSFYA